jgi:T5SS/PEP-CTERM-associated repeat protein
VGYGSLTISNLANFQADEIFVGNQLGGVGEVTATGTGSTITATRSSNQGIFTIGKDGGVGTMNIELGAHMLTTTTGGNDFWVGSGFFDADPGDPLNPIVRSVGTLNLDGVGSFAETDDLNVGIFGGIGFLNVTSGATIVLTDQAGGGDTNFGSNNGAGGEQSTGTGVIDGDNSRLEARAIIVGVLGTGSLTVSNGGEVRSVTTGSNLGNVNIGNTAGSDGVMAVYGTATNGTTESLLYVDESLSVGRAGLGVLRIGQDLSGAAVGTGALQVDVDLNVGEIAGNNADNRVFVAGSEVVANIDNAIYVGRAGKGTLEITEGATTNTRFVRVGEVAGGNGTLLLDDSTLNVTNSTSNVVIGTRGTGVATARNGATLTTDTLTVGFDDVGDGSLTINDATVTVGADNAGDLFIGGGLTASGILGGTGVVTVENGGQLFAADEAYIGGNAGGDGTLTVRGGTSQVVVGEADATTAINDTLFVGETGQGVLDIGDGGSVIAEALAVTHVLNGVGGEIILGSALAPGGSLEVRGHTRIGDADAGSMTVSNGATFTTSAGGDNHVAIIGDNTQSGGSLLTIDNATWNHTGTGRIDVGNFSNGTRSKLEVKNGGTVTGSTTLFVANQTGSTGELVVDGPGSTILGLTRLAMGDNGNGLMMIQAGGVVAASSATGFVEIGAASGAVGVATVTGAGSTLAASDFLSVGDETNTNGTLNVEGGGTASTTTGHVFIGRSGSAVGAVTVQDAGSLLSSGDSLFVGGRLGSQGGTGTLNVNTGGTVSVTNELKVWNTGTLNLNGGTIEVATFDVVSPADFTFSTGTLRFTGAKTLGTTSLAQIFSDSPNPTLVANQHLDINGIATISSPIRLDGGTLSVGLASQASLDDVDWDAGTLEITDQTLTVSPSGQLGQSIVLDSDQILNVPKTGTVIAIQGNSDLNVIRGGLNSARTTNGGLIVISKTSNVDFDSDNNGSGLTNDGDLVVIDSTIAGSVINNGSLEIVDPVIFTDGLTLSATSALGIDIDGLLDFDSIIVGGDATLDGLLSVSLGGGFAPSPGEQFTVLTASSITNNGLALGGSSASQFDLLVSGSNVILQAIGVDVDLDNDGDVDGADFLAIQRTNPALIPDWESQYGSGSPLSAATGAVPEPSSGLLALLAAAMIGIRGQSRRA